MSLVTNERYNNPPTTISIICFLLGSLALPLEIVRIILLGVPSLLRVENIVSPSHHFAGLDCCCEGLGFNCMLGISVSGSTCEKHQRALVGTPRLKFDDPVLANLLVLWVVVHVFALWMIDTCNL